MGGSFKKPDVVRGHTVPGRRFTGWAAIYFVAFVCLPILGLALVLDGAFYLIARNALDSCYAILCLFE